MLSASQHIILSPVLPASIIVLSICYDILYSVRFPTPVIKAYGWLTFPFRNFLHLEDLEEASETTLDTPRWKMKTMVLLSLFEAVVLLTKLGVDHIHSDLQAGRRLNDMIMIFLWVSVSFK